VRSGATKPETKFLNQYARFYKNIAAPPLPGNRCIEGRFYLKYIETRRNNAMVDLKIVPPDLAILHARQAVDRYVIPVPATANGGSYWKASANMIPSIWGDKARKGKADTAKVVFSAWATFCAEQGWPCQTNEEQILEALKIQERDAAKKKAEAVEDKQREIFDVDAFFQQEQEKFMTELENEGRLIPQYIFNTEGKAGTDKEIIERWEATGTASALNGIRKRYRQHMTNKKPSIKYTDKDFEDILSQMLIYVVTKARVKVYEDTRYDGQSTFGDFCHLFKPFYLSFMGKSVAPKPEDELRLDIAAIYHFIWQIKRKLTDRTVTNSMAPVLYGKGGIGKDEAFVPTILYPIHGWVRKYEDAAHLVDVERHGKAVWNYLVGYLEEMAVSKAGAATLKAVITTSDLQVRSFGQNKLVDTVKSKMTFLGSSNIPFKSYSTDRDNSRRFCELHLTLLQSELSDEIKNFRGSRDGDGKMRPGSWASENSYDLWRMVDETCDDDVFAQYPSIKEKLLARQKEMTPRPEGCAEIEAIGFHSRRVDSNHLHAVFFSIDSIAAKWRGKVGEKVVRSMSIEQIASVCNAVLGSVQVRDGKVGYYLVPLNSPFDEDVDNQIEQEYIEESTEGGFEW
jgi:hypothetical protein